MKNKAVGFAKNISYTLFSNMLSLLISTLAVLIVPRLFGLEEYGYLQLYMFYAGYVGILHFGWNDGVYLRYGGAEYDDLDIKVFYSQFSMAILLQFIIGSLIFVFSYLFMDDPNRIFIFTMISFSLIFTNMQSMLSFILQATNQIKEYSIVTMANKITYFIMLLIFIFIGIRRYEYMVVADLTGRLVSMIIAMYYCKEIVFNKLSDFYFDFTEMFANITAGIKLMISNLASMLVIGIVRFGIEQNWNVETFGKVSLTLSISNMMMIFINAIGLVLFPVLRRINQNQYKRIYSVMRDFLMAISLGLLIIYYPAKVALTSWLAEYSEALNYMALLFPIFIFEGKMSLLINTFLKTMREEALLLRINLITLFLSSIATVFTAYVLNNLDLTIVSIVIILAFRSVFAEFQMTKLLDINISKDITFELLLTLVFILSGWFIDSWMTPFIYGVSYLLYLYLKRRDFKESFHEILQLLK